MLIVLSGRKVRIRQDCIDVCRVRHLYSKGCRGCEYLDTEDCARYKEFIAQGKKRRKQYGTEKECK